jgi:hypothetical protein
VNPLQQTERETTTGGASQALVWISILLLPCVIVLAWLLAGPPAESYGLPVMILWILVIIAAVAALVLRRWVSYDLIYPAAAFIIIAGTVAAFLSGDKFDAIRAAIVSVVLIALGYQRRGRPKSALKV